jgi:hypothetical protein
MIFFYKSSIETKNMVYTKCNELFKFFKGYSCIDKALTCYEVSEVNEAGQPSKLERVCVFNDMKCQIDNITILNFMIRQNKLKYMREYDIKNDKVVTNINIFQ